MQSLTSLIKNYIEAAEKDGQGYPFVPIQAKNVGRKHCFLPHISFLSTGPPLKAKRPAAMAGLCNAPDDALFPSG